MPLELSERSAAFVDELQGFAEALRKTRRVQSSPKCPSIVKTSVPIMRVLVFSRSLAPV